MHIPDIETSVTLIAQAQREDGVAWQRLTELYLPLIQIWIRRLGVDQVSTDDIAQQVLVAAWTGIHRFQRGTIGQSLRAWLYGITRNKVKDYFRSRRKIDICEGGTTAGQAFANIPSYDDSECDVSSERDILLRRILELTSRNYDPKNWQAFWLTTIKHLPAKDVAIQLNMSPVAVRQAKYRIVRRLRIELESLGESLFPTNSSNATDSTQ